MLVRQHFADAIHQNTFDYDLIINNKKIDVKTKRFTSKFTPNKNWTLNIPNYNTKQKCDYYCFVGMSDDYKIAREEGLHFINWLPYGEGVGAKVILPNAAEAIGSIYRGKRAGSIGRFGAFSFHGTKTITTGEGGVFVTNDSDLYEQVLTLSNHGRSRLEQRQFWPETVGFKYKMSNIQAAIGFAQDRGQDWRGTTELDR